jgi:sigma-E factor negative regulatory protein RseB
MAFSGSLLRSLLACLCALPFLVQAAGKDSADDPWLLLEKAGQAAHKLSYKGIFVYQSGRTVSSMQIIHMNYDQGEFARLVSLDGAPREVLRQGNDVLIYNQQKEKVMIEKRRVQSAFPALLPGLVDALKTSYVARLSGTERVGGREVQIIHLVPRDRYRYGYQFSVDRESGLLLKSIMLDEQGAILEQVAFNQLQLIDAGDLNWFRPQIENGKTYEVQPEETVTPVTVEGDVWIMAQLPTGYRKVDQVRRNVPGKRHPVNHLVFSDGLASVSLFIEPLANNAVSKQGHMVQGATNLYAVAQEGYQIIVVGEVPEATVKQIASAVNFKK